MTDRTPLPVITRGEQRAIERLFAGSFNIMDCLRGFVRNRSNITADGRFPLDRLFDQSEAALEAAGFWPEDYDRAEAVSEPLRAREPVDITMGPLVILESPFAGEVEKNVAYARQCLRDSLLRGEHPIASHLLYTQPGVLDDNILEERRRGIEAGLAWRKAAQRAVFYVDRGWSSGMLQARDVYEREGFPFEVRQLVAGEPDTSDIPEADASWFDGARLVHPEELSVGEVHSTPRL